jgi:hypothetical protein
MMEGFVHLNQKRSNQLNHILNSYHDIIKCSIICAMGFLCGKTKTKLL